LVLNEEQIQKNNDTVEDLVSAFIRGRESASSSQTLAYESLAETIRFLWLCSLGHTSLSRLVSLEVDETWHEFLIDPTFYTSLCLALPGRTIIQHNTDQPPNEPNNSEVALCFAALSDYVRLFGSFNETTVVYWPAAAELANLFGLSLLDFSLQVVKFRRSVFP